MTRVADRFERVEIECEADLERWLEANHTRRESIWLVTYKKADAQRYVPAAAIVDIAIAYGWIDSLPRKLDGRRTMRLLSPRKPGSGWSKVNKERVERLRREGRMRTSGEAAVRSAQEDGSWDKLAEVDALEIPIDLARALAEVVAAREKFDAFPRSVRRGILEWISAAKRPDTRARRIAKTARMAGEGKRAQFDG